MDVVGIKNYIIDNPESIEKLLDRAGFLQIRDLGKEYRCAYDEKHTPMGTQIKKDTLSMSCHSLSFFGDIVTLLQRKLDYSFRQTLNWMCEVLGFKADDFKDRSIVLPFGGFFKDVKKMSLSSEDDVPTLDARILSKYGVMPCSRFTNDGITVATQIKYGVGYDIESGRISVPWHSTNDELIGIMGRINTDDESVLENVAKWFPIKSFTKEHTLYGFSKNYSSIIEKDIMLIGESEKFAMQLDSMGLDVGVSLGGNVITDSRASLIKSTMVSTIIVCYDEGLDIKDNIMDGILKLKSDTDRYSNAVGYVYDYENKYMKSGSKCSPSDLGKDVFNKLLEECVIWI